MVLRFSMLAVAFFFISCSDIARDNPYDPDGINYVGDQVPSSSSGGTPVPVGPIYYEGETYETVVIGTQIWFKRNLNYAAPGSKCYGNIEANCTIYGKLYNWETAISVCPSGWRLPSAGDWNALVTAVGGANAGRYLKAISGWNDGNGTDTYGFAALPGGFYSAMTGAFAEAGINGSWWTASEYNSLLANSRWMHYSDDVVSNGDTSYKTTMMSVRCMRN
ncbi:MAG: hypothetical protein LBC75_05610 [Fibromonadaceae bacterium]|jgi:uncharacterized protein (TIGR02145 family)|nr:hypothetical protein [Fibromonadaceae bacterium]